MNYLLVACAGTPLDTMYCSLRLASDIAWEGNAFRRRLECGDGKPFSQPQSVLITPILK